MLEFKSPKAIIIGDPHFGLRELVQEFVQYQVSEYKKAIEYARTNGIKVIIFMGDLLDNRQGIGFKTLETLSKTIIDEDMDFIYIAGNHDVYSKSNNDLNGVRLIFGKYDNFHVVNDEAVEIMIGGVKSLFVPWINKDNHDQCMKMIKDTDAEYCFGHFEVNGFQMVKGHDCTDGLKPSIFKKFRQTFSGHFHLRMTALNITYVGSMCQLNWNDYNDQKAFHVIDFESNRADAIISIDQLFFKIFVREEDDFKDFDIETYRNKDVKIYLNRKLTKKEEKIIVDLLQVVLKYEIIDNTIILEQISETTVEDEDLASIFTEFISEQEGIDKADKKALTKLFHLTHDEALTGV